MHGADDRKRLAYIGDGLSGTSGQPSSVRSAGGRGAEPPGHLPRGACSAGRYRGQPHLNARTGARRRLAGKHQRDRSGTEGLRRLPVRIHGGPDTRRGAARTAGEESRDPRPSSRDGAAGTASEETWTEYVGIVKVDTAAGVGASVGNEQVTGLAKFSHAWLRSQGLIASRCRIIAGQRRVDGADAAGRLRNPSQPRGDGRKDRKIFVIRVGDELRVKRAVNSPAARLVAGLRPPRQAGMAEPALAGRGHRDRRGLMVEEVVRVAATDRGEQGAGVGHGTSPSKPAERRDHRSRTAQADPMRRDRVVHGIRTRIGVAAGGTVAEPGVPRAKTKEGAGAQRRRVRHVTCPVTVQAQTDWVGRIRRPFGPSASGLACAR